MQVGERARSLGITHIISSDLGRTKTHGGDYRPGVRV